MEAKQNWWKKNAYDVVDLKQLDLFDQRFMVSRKEIQG